MMGWFEFAALATYNSERSRGILHTDRWAKLMAEEQRRFNAGEPSQFPGVDYPAIYREPTLNEGADT